MTCRWKHPGNEGNNSLFITLHSRVNHPSFSSPTHRSRVAFSGSLALTKGQTAAFRVCCLRFHVNTLLPKHSPLIHQLKHGDTKPVCQTLSVANFTGLQANCFYFVMQQERAPQSEHSSVSVFFSRWTLSACVPAHSSLSSEPTAHPLALIFSPLRVHCMPAFNGTQCPVVTHGDLTACYTTPVQRSGLSVCALTFLLAELYITGPLNHSGMSNVVQRVNFHNTWNKNIVCVGVCVCLWAPFSPLGPSAASSRRAAVRSEVASGQGAFPKQLMFGWLLRFR